MTGARAPTPRAPDTRERILATTAGLFRRQGYTGTGLKQIVAAARAPFGSIYHHFPGGKEQLGAEVIATSGDMYRDLIVTLLRAAPDLVTGVRHCFQGAAALLRETDFADACPIATVALEVASSHEPLRIACAEVFERWIDAGMAEHEAAGIARPRARQLTILFIAALEGAFVLCRATRSTEALDVAGEAVARAIEQSLPAPRPAS